MNSANTLLCDTLVLSQDGFVYVFSCLLVLFRPHLSWDEAALEGHLHKKGTYRKLKLREIQKATTGSGGWRSSTRIHDTL